MPITDITNQLFCIRLKNDYAIRSFDGDYSCGYDCPIINSYIVHEYHAIHVFDDIANFICGVCNDDIFEIRLFNECLDCVLAYVDEDFEPSVQDPIILVESATDLETYSQSDSNS